MVLAPHSSVSFLVYYRNQSWDLYTLHIINDDVDQISPRSCISLFADVMALYCPICSVAEFSIIHNLSTWIKDNYLSLQLCHAYYQEKGHNVCPSHPFCRCPMHFHNM